MNLKSLAFFCILFSFVGFQVSAQLNCLGDRYYSEVFPTVSVDYGVQFGENLQPNLLNPNATQKLYADIYRPTGDTESNRPLIILAFGGGFVSGSRLSPDIVDLCNRFAKRGYVTVSIDYRLSIDLLVGADERQATLAVMKAVHDMKGAIRFFRKNASTYGINEDYIYIGGVSAGAVTALHTAYIDKISEVPSIISGDTAGIGGLSGLSGNPGFSDEVAGVISLSGAMGDTSWIESDDLPVVSVHGSNDDIVPFGDGTISLFGLDLQMYGPEQFHPHALSVSTHSAFLPFQGAGHTPFILGGNAVAYMDSTDSFVRDFLYDLLCNSVNNNQQLPGKSNVPKVYPNPVSEVLFVTTSENERLSDMAIINTEGKVVFSKTNFSSSGININVSDLPKGVYFLKMNLEGSLLYPLFRKVVVK